MKQKSKAKTLLELFCSFFRIGAFTFGGGYAMIPIIEKEMVEKHKWIKSEDILDIFYEKLDYYMNLCNLSAMVHIRH